MAWSDDHTGADWTATSFLNMFEEAIWERELAANYDASPGSPSTYSAGTDVQAATFLAGFQSRVEAIFSLFLNGDSTDVEGIDISSYDGFFTSTDFNTVLPYFSGASEGFDAISIDGWRRKRPREITGTNVLFDTQGNPIGDGDVAFCLSDSSIRRYDAPEDTYFLADPGVSPDILTSSAGVERTIEDNGTLEDQYGHPAVGGQVARADSDGLIYTFDGGSWVLEEDPEILPDRIPDPAFGLVSGQVVAGDIIGGWIFNDLRDMLNLLKATTAGASTDEVSITGHDSLTISASEAAAYAEADAAWTYNTQTGFGSIGGGVGAHQRVSITAEWNGFGVLQGFYPTVSSAKYDLDVTATTSHRDRDVTLFGAYQKITVVSPGDNTYAYDTQGNGDAPASQQISTLSSFSISSGSTTGATQVLAWDDTLIPPNYPTVDTSTHATTTKRSVLSWRIAGYIAVVEWDFAYGP